MKVVGEMSEKDIIEMLGKQYEKNKSVFLLDKMTADDFAAFLVESDHKNEK